MAKQPRRTAGNLDIPESSCIAFPVSPGTKNCDTQLANGSAAIIWALGFRSRGKADRLPCFTPLLPLPTTHGQLPIWHESAWLSWKSCMHVCWRSYRKNPFWNAIFSWLRKKTTHVFVQKLLEKPPSSAVSTLFQVYKASDPMQMPLLLSTFFFSCNKFQHSHFHTRERGREVLRDTHKINSFFPTTRSWDSKVAEHTCPNENQLSFQTYFH